jgi:CheY-like chemotaxis protein
VPLILIVEDEAPIRELLVVLLGAHGYRTATAANGQQALTRIDAERPDLVLTDVMMPVMSGLELCRQLKDDPQTAGIPVILTSAVDARHTIAAGADAFVPKPFDLDRVEALIDSYLVVRRPPD